MTVTYEIDADELNENFLESLRSLFKGRRLKLTVEEEQGVVSNPVMIKKLNEALNSPDAYVFKENELAEFSENLLAEGLEGFEKYKKNAQR